MISHATPEFWACYSELPDTIKTRARAAYALWVKAQKPVAFMLAPALLWHE